MGVSDLSVGTSIPIGVFEATGSRIPEGDAITVDVEYRARIVNTRIPAGAIVTWSATAAPGGGIVHTHPGADSSEVALHCQAAGLIYLSVKVDASGVTYNSKELSIKCDPAVVPPPPGAGGSMVTFRIPLGTNNKPWNTAATSVVVKIGQTVRIINDDVVPHRLHTGGAPCAHQGSDSPPGGFYDCVISRTVNSAAGSTYDHNFGTSARLYIDATN